MESLKKRVLLAFIAAALVTFPKMTSANLVHADASIKDGKSVVVKSTDIKINKVLVVPKKPEVAKSTTKTLSRGNSKSSSTKSTNNAVKSSDYGITATYSGNSSVVAYAYKFMGRPYVWGASGPNAFDCSGFVAYVYQAFGVSLPHYTGSQYASGTKVSQSALSPGDLVFFNTYSSISHVGIYIGGGQFIHASSGSARVTVSSLSESYYASRFAGAVRVK